MYCSVTIVCVVARGSFALVPTPVMAASLELGHEEEVASRVLRRAQVSKVSETSIWLDIDFTDARQSFVCNR